MNKAQLLDAVHDAGIDAGADFNDGIEPMGWLGWSIQNHILTVHFESHDHVKSEASWHLVPVAEGDGKR